MVFKKWIRIGSLWISLWRMQNCFPTFKQWTSRNQGLKSGGEQTARGKSSTLAFFGSLVLIDSPGLSRASFLRSHDSCFFPAVLVWNCITVFFNIVKPTCCVWNSRCYQYLLPYTISENVEFRTLENKQTKNPDSWWVFLIFRTLSSSSRSRNGLRQRAYSRKLDRCRQADGVGPHHVLLHFVLSSKQLTSQATSCFYVRNCGVDPRTW